MDLCSWVDLFLQGRRAAGCTVATLRCYAHALEAFCRSGLAPTPEGVQAYLDQLRARMKPTSVHHHYRALRVFFRWCVRTGRLDQDPLADLKVRAPRTLPRVPTPEEVAALLRACPDTPEGRRNRAMVCLLADSGLRKEELRRLRVRDVDLVTRTVRVWSGKGQKDRVTYFGDATASVLRSWLSLHPDPRPEAPLFCTGSGDMLGPFGIGQILGRLSRRAGIRRIGPHALRHYAATSLMRSTGDLELVRRVLGHTTLAMALRYASVADEVIRAKFQAHSPVDHLWAGTSASQRRR